MTVKLTEIVCILDRSGSMSRLAEETITGFNQFLKDQRDAGPGKVTLVIFDDRYEVVYEDTPLSQAPELTTDVYYTRGSTALLDAIGRTIARVKERQMKKTPVNTLVMIITDGQENCSREYVEEGQVKTMVRECIDHLNWTFMYLGANVDAFYEAQKMGIGSAFAANYDPSNVGTKHLYQTASAAASMTRSGGGMSAGGKTLSDIHDDIQTNDDSESNT